ncbi:MAG: hypothetical protein MJZ84_03965 [Paludibacteraceae bacterium]|nr:hypothetical protein [Paludibacteraceae bacterium]
MKKIYLFLAAALVSMSSFGAAIDPGYNEPEGSFYSCYYFPNSGKAGVQVPQLFMPYMDEYTFTSRHGAGDWKMGDQTATNAETFSPKYAFGTYTAEGMPELTARDTTYVYGSGSTTGSARRVYVGDGAYHYITNAKHYAVKQATMVTKMSSYLKFRTYFFNRPDQVMLVSKILIPITTNKNGETLADLFPTEDSHMKVAVYQAICSRTSLDKYSRAIDYSKRLVDTLTLTKANYMESSNVYAGLLIAELPEPVAITGAFCVEITDYETMGAETRIIGDNTTGTTSQYLKYKNAGDSQLSVYAASNNYEIAVYGAMPSIAKASEAEAIEIPSIGGAAEAFDIYSSTKITAKEITLPEWANLDTIMYEGDTYAANKKINIVLSASANTTGTERTGEMVINNLGMKLTVAIKQDVKKDVPYIIIADTKKAITIPTLGGESEPFLVRTNTTLTDWQVNLPEGYSYTATPATDDTVAITLKHEGYLKATHKDTMAIAIESETLCKIAYKQNGIIIQYIDEPIAEFWAEYEANSKFYYTADGKNYSLYFFYTPLKREDVTVSAPDWCEVNLRDSVYKEQNALALTMKAPEATQTERTGELKIQYKGEDILVYNLRQLGFHPYAKDIYSSQAEGGTVSGNGGQVKFMRYTNTEWLWKTNVDFAKWSIDAPEWIQATLTARTADTISLKMFVETKDYSVEGRKGTVTIKADTITMTLDITQTAAEKSMSYYNVDGALYYGTSNTAGAYTTQYMFVPYADSVAVVSQVGPGTWYGGKNHTIDSTNIGSDTYWIYAPSNVNNYVMYLPYFQSDIKEIYSEWQWGGVIKYRANARMRIGSGRKAYLCAPQYHPDSLASEGKTSDMYMRSGTFSGQSIHYCYGTKVGNEEQGYYDSIGTYIHTNGVVWADSIYLPIYNYAIYKEGAPQEKASIFGDNGKVTLTIYPATTDADGNPVVDREHPMYEVTADSTNFLWNSSTAYKGAITFVKTEKNPLGIEEVVPFISDGGDFYIEFTGFNESGVDFGLYSNGSPVAGQENGKGWFYKNGEYKKVWSKQYSLYITLYGFFPFIKTMYGAEEINVNVMGDEVSIIYPELDPEKQEQSDLLIRANRDFGEWEIENPDWVTLNFDTTEIWDASNFIDITFEVEPNDGPEREGEIVLTNHGVSKFITIKQAADASGFINLFDRKDQKNVDKLLKNGNIIIRRDNETFTIDGRKLE